MHSCSLLHYVYNVWSILVVMAGWTAALHKGASASAADYLQGDNDYDADLDLFAFEPCPSRCKDFDVDLVVHSRKHKHNRNRNHRSSSSSSSSSSEESGSARIFYLILIHNLRTANDAVFLFRAIRDPRNIIVIHYDKKVEHLLLLHDDENNTNGEHNHSKSSSSTLLREIRECPCGSKVRVESVHSVEWSKWSMNLPTLWGMELAVSLFSPDDSSTDDGTAAANASADAAYQWDVFINLSGDTIPVYTVDTMAKVLHQLPYNFVTSRSCETGLLPTSVYTFPEFWHKRRHYTVDETEEDPVFQYFTTDVGATAETRLQHNKTVTTHFGSQWVILQRPFVEWFVDQLRDDNSWPSQFRDYLMQSGKLMTDETFVPTVLVHANGDHDDDDDDDHRNNNNGNSNGNADFSHTLPVVSKDGALLYRNGTASGIRDVRFERMDEHYPTAFGVFPEMQRYKVPESLVQSNILEQPKVWGPYFLGVYDLGLIRETGALFARKVSAMVDPNMVRLLPVDRAEQIPDIHWPLEVSLTDRPDWHAEKKLWTEMAERKQRRASSSETEADDEEL